MQRKWLGYLVILGLILSGISYWHSLPNPHYLRLHVLANSDMPEDQVLKLAVRDAVVKYMAQQFEPVENAAAAKSIALTQTDELQQIAESVIQSHGYTYPVKIIVGAYDFPLKTYQELTLPAGKYEAVRVVIGEGKGQNWWCVLFPPLCIIAAEPNGIEFTPSETTEVKWKIKELLFPEEE